MIGERSAREARAQRLALDERHRVERQAVRVARREHRNDVRLLQRGDRPDLALEALDADALRELGRQHLDDDLPLEPRLFGDEDAAHAAAAELALEAVGVAEGVLELVPQLETQGVGESFIGGGGTGEDTVSRAERLARPRLMATFFENWRDRVTHVHSAVALRGGRENGEGRI